MNLNEEPRKEIVRGLASASLLASLLIGVPILLMVGVGWPLPKGIPSASDVFDAIQTGAIPPSLILKPISLVVWVLWVQLLAGVGIEVWAHLCGRVAPRVAFIPSFVQRWTARQLATALVIAFSLQHAGTAMADNQELFAPKTIEIDLEAPDAKPLVHTVERRDSLRMLAERYLGDPSRWTEVFVLNQGQAQAVGGSLNDPARLEPGWELVMPADAHLPTSARLTFDETPDSSQQSEDTVAEQEDLLVTVQERDTLWGLAADHLDDPERWVEIFNSNQDTIQDPDVILPGWQLEIPAHAGEPTTVAPPNHPLPQLAGDAAPVAAFTTVKPTVVASVPSSVAEEQPVTNRQAMLAVGGLGVFISSLGWMLARLRKTQRRRLPSGRIPVPPSESAVVVDQQLQAASDPDSALFLDASLRVMSARVAGNPPPDIIGATLNSDSVSVHLGSPGEAPPGFHSSDDSTTWTLPRGAVLENLLAEADDVPAPLPTLVSMGTRDGKECLLNLEHMVALSLEGDPKPIMDLCTAIATQLASSHLADDLTVICVGFGQDLTVFERVEHVPDVARALERIRHHKRQSQALLGNHPSPVDSRVGSSGGFWPPVVALVPNRLSQEEADLLLSACGSSVCLVAHGLQGATWLGHLDEDGVLLHPIGLRLESHRLSGTTVDAVAELASIAKDTEGVTLATAPSPELQCDPRGVVPSDTEIEVRVLGPVEVAGAVQPLTSQRALDLLAFLAFHPEGADRDQLKAQIWPPDRPPSDSAFANTVSRARRALGVDDNNETYLPRVNAKGVYRLRPEVRTDVSRLEALVSAARNDPSDRGRECLQAALELVRGTPFTGGSGEMYRWADFGLRTQLECLVDTAAHELARRCIDAGDLQGAGQAAMTSLHLVGVCEQCYRWRLIAAAENPTEVRQIMAELANLLKRENGQSEADHLFSPDLAELYEELMSGRAVFS